MKDFFKVADLESVLEYAYDFPRVETEEVLLYKSSQRILAADIISEADLPDFARSTMDGYAVRASSTFGITEENPAYLTVKGSVVMGKSPPFSIGQGEAAGISTGGMMPDGADSVVMIEYTELIDETTIEVYKSVAPGRHVVEVGEDFCRGETILSNGQKLRPQETGLLAAFGKERVRVYKKPVIGIISTGDEVVPIDKSPGPGQIRDVNTYTLSSLVQEAGGIPVSFGIIQDDYDSLFTACSLALDQSDMVLISGGSSVGARDFTIDALSALPESKILAHGISISPGKPTILARAAGKPLWGLPGHVVSAIIVFSNVVRPFIEHIGGLSIQNKKIVASALLTRNIPSAQGRIDYVRVRLIEKDGALWAEPIFGKSGLINTMVKADGLVAIGINTEGIDKGKKVSVIPL